MPKFRKKPVIIEAEQYKGEAMVGVCNDADCCADKISRPHVHTIHNNQNVLIKSGDWIIPEPDGIHYYPCEESIFKNRYEPAE